MDIELSKDMSRFFEFGTLSNTVSPTVTESSTSLSSCGSLPIATKTGFRVIQFQFVLAHPHSNVSNTCTVLNNVEIPNLFSKEIRCEGQVYRGVVCIEMILTGMLMQKVT